MPFLNDLTDAVVARLKAAQAAGQPLEDDAAAVVLREDTHDLQNEINKSIGKIGMLMLVGMPHFVNDATLQNPNVQAHINFAVAVGEHPILWRKDQRHPASSLAQLVAQLLQNYRIAGFNPLRVARVDFVPDKKTQLYELAIETLLIAPKYP